jgi:hypothetical protein
MRCGHERRGKTIVSEAGGTGQKERRDLRAVLMKARGEPGVYVSQDYVTQQANVSDLRDGPKSSRG